MGYGTLVIGVEGPKGCDEAIKLPRELDVLSQSDHTLAWFASG
jgi:hypothetical protein